MSEYPLHTDPYISGPLFVGKLQESGIHPNNIKKLAAAGLNTIASVAYSPKIRLATIEGISGPMADNILAEGSYYIYISLENMVTW
jgi:DNA repair protein RAD51